MNFILELELVAKSFGGVQAVDDVSLSLASSQIAALIGPNGAGKTTLFNLISGFLRPEKGSLRYKGNLLNCLAPHAIANLGMGRTFQDLRLIRGISVLDNVLLALHNTGLQGLQALFVPRGHCHWQQVHRQTAEHFLEFVGLLDEANDPAEALSYGQQKLLTLACCLAMGADLLLLDEPVAGVEPNTVDRVVDLLSKLRGQGKSIFLIEHTMPVVSRIADVVFVLDEGRLIAQGTPAQVMEDPHVLEAYLT